jgi:NADH-quinone oxidoreductase subunit N
MSVYIQDLALTIPLLSLFVFSLIPIGAKVFNKNTESKPLLTFVIAIAAIAVTGLAIAVRSTTEVTFAFENAITYGPMLKLASVMLILIALLTVLLSYQHPAIPKNQYSEHVFLLLSTMIGMMVLMFANDLILVFVGIELLSLPLYVLIGIGGNALIPKESSFKYFVLGSFASAFLLFGVAFIYGATQTTDIQKIIEGKNIHQALLLMGTLIFLIGLFFKVALVPFHAWLPDVYQGAPTPITAFMATSVKLSIFVFLLQFLPVMQLVDSPALMYALQWVAILTMFFGNLIAIKQSNFKRMLAYSSISHSGYLFLGIIAGFVGVGDAGTQGIFFYLLTYIFMTIGAFAIICLFESKEGQELTLDHLKGLAKTHPWTAFCLTAFLLSLAGIPPMGGFFAKVFLFSSAIVAQQFWLVVWAVMSSVIGVYYYLRPIVYMYMKEKEIHEEFHQNESVSVLATIYFCLIMVFLLGFAAQPFLNKIIHSL